METGKAAPDGPEGLGGSEIDALAVRLAASRPALFLDYDGTLTGMAPRPELAVLSDAMRGRVGRVAALCPTAIVTGRDVEDVKALVGLPGLIYAGSHGLDIEAPSGIHRFGDEFRPALERATAALERALAHIEGALVQPKRYAITVHTRLVDPSMKPEVAAITTAVLSGEPTLRGMPGKEMLELRPDLDWNKGTAVLHLIDVEGLGDRHPVYIGDDITDEDAFLALKGRGFGIMVGDHGAPTAADARLPDIESVGRLLDRIADHLAR